MEVLMRGISDILFFVGQDVPSLLVAFNAGAGIKSISSVQVVHNGRIEVTVSRNSDAGYPVKLDWAEGHDPSEAFKKWRQENPSAVIRFVHRLVNTRSPTGLMTGLLIFYEVRQLSAF